MNGAAYLVVNVMHALSPILVPLSLLLSHMLLNSPLLAGMQLQGP